MWNIGHVQQKIIISRVSSFNKRIIVYIQSIIMNEYKEIKNKTKKKKNRKLISYIHTRMNKAEEHGEETLEQAEQDGESEHHKPDNMNQ